MTNVAFVCSRILSGCIRSDIHEPNECDVDPTGLPALSLMSLAMVIAGECTLVFLENGFFVHVVAGEGEPGEIVLDLVQWEVQPPFSNIYETFELMVRQFPRDMLVRLEMPRIGATCKSTAPAGAATGAQTPVRPTKRKRSREQCG